MVLLNMILTAVIVFTVVPTTMRTNKLIAKVTSNIDLELESSSTETTETADTQINEISLEDTEVYEINDPMTINLMRVENDTKNHYAKVNNVSFSINTKSKEYKKLNPTILPNESYITEIIQEEFQKFTFLNVTENKNNIKVEILRRVQEHFKSDFIISVSIGELIVE